MSFEETLDVPARKSPRSTSATARPARAGLGRNSGIVIAADDERVGAPLAEPLDRLVDVVIGYSSCSRILVAAVRAV
jgi:hypothetical protein